MAQAKKKQDIQVEEDTQEELVEAAAEPRHR